MYFYFLFYITVLTSHAKIVHRGRGISAITYNYNLRTLVANEIVLKLVNRSDFFNTAWQVVPNIASVWPKRILISISSCKWDKYIVHVRSCHYDR